MNPPYFTKRLAIKPVSLNNIELTVSWLNDPEIMQFSERRHQKHTRESQLDYIYSAVTVAPNMLLEIYPRDASTPIGSISAYVDQNNKVADVGILIGDKTQWRKGFGFEAWKAVCDNLLANGVEKIEAGCMSVNEGMIAIMEKYGMEFEGHRQNHFLLDNVRLSMRLYGKTVE